MVDGKRTISFILSFFIPGAGQIYLDQEYRGIIILVIFFTLFFVLPWVFGWWGYLMTTGFWIWQLYDAHRIGKQLGTKPKKSETEI